MTTHADVIAAARTWIGTPYRHQASLKGVGCDCIGLVGGVGVELGLPEAIAWANDGTLKGYSRSPDPEVLLTGCRRYLDMIEIAAARPGDIIVMRFERDPQHFAIISDPARIIHAYAVARKVCETGIDGRWRWGQCWRSMITSAWRFRAVY